MNKFFIISISLIIIAGSALWYFSDTVSASIAKIVTSLTKTTTKAANNTGLVGYWNFDDCDTCSTAVDRSGNGNTGTMYATAGPTAGDLHITAGKIGNGIDLNGSTGFIEMSDTPFDFTSSFSISAWLRADAASNGGVPIWKTSSYGIDYGLTTTGGLTNQFSFGIYNGTTWTASNMGATVQTGRWYHIVGVFDDNNNLTKIYVNGELKDSDSYTTTAANSAFKFHIGNADLATDSNYFDGKIDEVRTYNRALSAAEVKGLYEDTKRFFVNMPMPNLVNDGLISFWSFNGKDTDWSQATAEARDTSGNAYHGDAISMDTSSVRPGINGQALYFDGSADYVDAGTSVLSGNTGAFSTSAWFKSNNILNTTSASVTIVSKDDRTTGALKKMFQVQATGVGDTSGGSTLVGYVWDESAGTYLGRATTITFNAGQWYHMVFTYDGTTNQSGVLLYINGVQYSTANYSGGTFLGIDDTSANFLVGAYTNASAKAGFFNGQIDEVRVYNKALSANEVVELYRAGKRE